MIQTYIKIKILFLTIFQILNLVSYFEININKNIFIFISHVFIIKRSDQTYFPRNYYWKSIFSYIYQTHFPIYKIWKCFLKINLENENKKILSKIKRNLIFLQNEIFRFCLVWGNRYGFRFYFLWKWQQQKMNTTYLIEIFKNDLL